LGASEAFSRDFFTRRGEGAKKDKAEGDYGKSPARACLGSIRSVSHTPYGLRILGTRRRIVNKHSGFESSPARKHVSLISLKSSLQAGLGFAERGFDIRSGKPAPLRPRPESALYSLNKVPAPDCAHLEYGYSFADIGKHAGLH